jgi:hypothetical protein
MQLLLWCAAMYPYQLANWTVFLSVAAGVAATLTGLIFVAVSINLSRILEFPGLSARAAESILQLVCVLMFSMVALVPGQSLSWLGIQLAIGAVLIWLVQIRFQRRSSSHDKARKQTRPLFSYLLSHTATIMFLITGISIVTKSAGGLYWLVPGVILSLSIGVANAWVLLVEILR